MPQSAGTGANTPTWLGVPRGSVTVSTISRTDCSSVIASAAKQSSALETERMDCFAALAMTPSPPPLVALRFNRPALRSPKCAQRSPGGDARSPAEPLRGTTGYRNDNLVRASQDLNALLRVLSAFPSRPLRPAFWQEFATADGFRETPDLPGPQDHTPLLITPRAR